MSLIGSLEDLSLGDILQIISLSQKSGVLALRSGGGEGRIRFRAGLVCAAATKARPDDLRGLLVDGGFVPAAEFEAAESASEGPAALGDLLVAAGVIARERLDALEREAVEAAVVEMFQWRTGDFSFDVRETAEPEDPKLVLAVGINAQYLAMEAARFGDESDRGAEPEETLPELSAHAMFGVVEDDDASDEGAAASTDAGEADVAPDAVGIVASAAVDRALAAEDAELDATTGEDEAEPEATADGGAQRDAAAEAHVAHAAPERELDAASAAGAATAAPFDAARPVVVIDAELPALEWAKVALGDAFERVHIFQRSDLGLTRIRQYLARATPPIVLLSPHTSVDQLSGIRNAADFVRRLKQQAPQIRIAWLVEDGTEAVASPQPADAVATRPAGHQLRAGAARPAASGLAGAFADLVRDLARGVEPGRAAGRAGADVAEADLEDLRRATQHLRDASSRGEVLPLVLDFAAQRFRRVAMWMVRDGVAIGMAQRGLAQCGGPDDTALRDVTLEAATSAWLARVLETRRPVAGPPRNEGDRALALALGDRLPEHAYLAPIESSGRVVAVVYADDLPGGAPPADTSALEVVLHHAGLALDRAALERALAEADPSR